MVVQACQDAPTAHRGSVIPTQALHITLSRPHTVLFLSTVTGGVAYRGVFTGALAEEFRRADGLTDVYTMFTRAVETSVIKIPTQTPKLRTTLQKQLIPLPAIRPTQT